MRQQFRRRRRAPSPRRDDVIRGVDLCVPRPRLRRSRSGAGAPCSSPRYRSAARRGSMSRCRVLSIWGGVEDGSLRRARCCCRRPIGWSPRLLPGVLISCGCSSTLIGRLALGRCALASPALPVAGVVRAITPVLHGGDRRRRMAVRASLRAAVRRRRKRRRARARHRERASRRPPLRRQSVRLSGRGRW